MNEIPLEHYLFISAALFCAGLIAVISRRNVIMVLLGIELMINAAVLNLLAFSKYDKDHEGQIMALFAIVLAAAGVAVALAIVLNVYERFKTIDPDQINSMKN